MRESWIAILGWQDQPTDAVLEYCEYLRDALGEQGVSLELFRVRWPELGWRRALRELRDKVAQSPNAIFILQYTALTWSRRGFSWRTLRVLRILKRNAGPSAIMFHDSEGYPGKRLVDRVRRSLQISTMRSAVRLADLAILNVPLANVLWLPAGLNKMFFIPVGANLPSPVSAWPQSYPADKQSPSVAIFSMSDGRLGHEEVEAVAAAMTYAAEKLGPLTLNLLGRNSDSAGLHLKEKLAGKPVEIVIHGLLAASDVVRVLVSSDAMLFVRGPISSRRGSAIAGIACGLPIIAREGWETGWPITEAGVVLLRAGDEHGYGPALFRVLSDRAYAFSLSKRSRQAYLHHFSWSVIAAQYIKAVRSG